MKLITKKCVIAVGVICAIGLCVVIACAILVPVAEDIEHKSTWGDVSGRGYGLRIHQSKIAIPFLEREIEVQYPRVGSKRFDSCGSRNEILNYRFSSTGFHRFKSVAHNFGHSGR